MRKIQRNVDYLTKDYEGFRKLMMDLIPVKTPEWTDTSQSDMGVVLLELLAHGLDVLSYYQDKQFNEAFITTAKTRRAIINHARMLGYDITLQVPARHRLTVTKSSEYIDQEITIRKGTKVGTDPLLGNAVVFEVDEDLVIPAGEQVGYVTVTHGETIHKDIVGVGNDSENQKFRLTYPDVLIDTLEVYTYLRIGDGTSPSNYVAWTRVRDFLSSSYEDRHFTTFVDEFNNTYIQFGNGKSGMKVPSEHNILCMYRVGGGAIGNVGLNTINTFLETDVIGIASITNAEPPIQYGVDIEDIEHIRESAPRLYRTMERAVTRQDFEDIVKTFKGVAKAKAVETFNTQNELLIYVATTSYDPLSSELKSQIEEKLNSIKMTHIKPIILDATYLDFDIDVAVIAYSNYLNSDVKARVEQALQENFSLDNMDFNMDIYLANIYRCILDVDGVKNVVINTPSTDITVYDSQNKLPRIARLNNITVSVSGGVSK